MVGGGDSALEEAIFLSRFAISVVVIHRRKELRASKIMQDRAFDNEKISFLFDTVVTEVLGENKVRGVRLRDTIVGRDAASLRSTGCSSPSATLRTPTLFAGQLEMDEAGYIRHARRHADQRRGRLRRGDVQDHVYRQAITAAGSGCMAALDADRYLADARQL